MLRAKRVLRRRISRSCHRRRCAVSPTASSTERRRCGGATAKRSICSRSACRSICNAKIDKISRIYWLLEDCKRYGTLPFAGLARAGFIAVQLLQSFVAVGVLSPEEHATFMASVDTVGSRIGHDFAHAAQGRFLARYGHLRPGTYDILSPRYDEAPDLYFDWTDRARTAGSHRDSRSRSSSCGTSSGCSKSTSSTSTS